MKYLAKLMSVSTKNTNALQHVHTRLYITHIKHICIHITDIILHENVDACAHTGKLGTKGRAR